MKLVIYPAVSTERLERISAAAEACSVVNAPGEAEAVKEITDADGFFGKMTPPILSAATRLRWVQTPTASLEHYMFPELASHSCQLSNARGLFSEWIADHVFGYIICFARNFHIYMRQQLQCHWEAVGGESGRVLAIDGPAWQNTIDRAHPHIGDCTLGVVGLGHIGSEVARRGLAFGMRVLAVDPIQTQAPDGVAALWTPDRLAELLAESDFVVIAAPHTPETEKLFRRPQFQQMKAAAYLINVGRGAIVDLADLTAALESKEISGAGLDVFETEPLRADHPLWKIENVIITPHVAGYSAPVAERHEALILDNIRRFVSGQPLRYVVDKYKWY